MGLFWHRNRSLLAQKWVSFGLSSQKQVSFVTEIGLFCQGNNEVEEFNAPFHTRNRKHYNQPLYLFFYHKIKNLFFYHKKEFNAAFHTRNREHYNLIYTLKHIPNTPFHTRNTEHYNLIPSNREHCTLAHTSNTTPHHLNLPQFSKASFYTTHPHHKLIHFNAHPTQHRITTSSSKRQIEKTFHRPVGLLHPHHNLIPFNTHASCTVTLHHKTRKTQIAAPQFTSIFIGQPLYFFIIKKLKKFITSIYLNLHRPAFVLHTLIINLYTSTHTQHNATSQKK